MGLFAQVYHSRYIRLSDLIPLWLANLKTPSRVPGAAWLAGTRATPPKKNRGVM